MRTDPIVVGTDGSARANVAVHCAGELARALGTAVHVVCAPEHLARQDWPPQLTAQQVVADADARLHSLGVRVQTHIPPGDAAYAIGAVAEQVGAQMIVVGNRGMTGVRRLLGSLPNSVSHGARCNVLIVPTQEHTPTELRGRCVVVATDGSQGSDRVLDTAIALAGGLGGELHIASVSRQADATLPAAADHAAERGVDATTHTPDEAPAQGILAIARQHEAAIVVVASKGMHAEDRERFGNAADKLSHEGSFRVLIVFTGAGGEAEAMGRVGAGAAGAAPGA